MPKVKQKKLNTFVPGKTPLRDLNKIIPGAKNFKYSELVYSRTALTHGIINAPNETQWKRLEDLARKLLQPIRDKFGPVRINSGYRNVELCLKIGGSPNSNHTRGYAADISLPNRKLADVVSWIYDNTPFSRMIAEYLPNGWIHIEYNPNSFPRIIMLKDKVHNYTRVSIDRFREMFNVIEPKPLPKSNKLTPIVQEEKEEKLIQDNEDVKMVTSPSPPPPPQTDINIVDVSKEIKKQGPFDTVRVERENQKEDK